MANLTDLSRLGLARFGRGCIVHPTVQLFNPAKISLGDNVRIDCFCVLSAGDDGITIGSHIHIGAGSYLFGGGGPIVLGDFVGLSPRVSIFTASDDFTEGYLRGPMVPMKYRKVSAGPVVLRRNAVIGSGAVVLPGVTIGTNSSVGALSIVRRDVNDHEIVSGAPPLAVGRRDPTLFEKLAAEWVREWESNTPGQSNKT